MPVMQNKDSGSSVWAIVLTHGGAEEITAACIESLLAQDYGALTVLLVDNASFDGSGERLRARFPGVEYFNTGANLGYTGGNNRGIQLALSRAADYVLVVNNDTVLEQNCVTVLVESARQCPDAGLIAPKILFFDDPSLIWYAGGDFSLPRATGVHRRELERDEPGERARLEEITFGTGCCFLMPADVARKVGGFRDDFFIYGEDLELSLRLSRGGYKLYYQPAARLLHREPLRRNDVTPFQIMQRDRNRRRIVQRHYKPWQRALFASWFYPTRVARLAQFAARGEWDRARALISAATADL